jgi:putative phosphoribosyl transferase
MKNREIKYMEKKVTFKNNKGFKLAASIIGIKKGIIQPAVIFAHGLDSGKDSPRNLYIAEGLVEKGFCCFLLDFTGHGESEGGASDITVEQFAQDLDAALNCIRRIKGIDPARIGICGSSMGGTAAIIRAANDGRIKVLALRSAPAEGYYQYANQVRIPVLIVQGDADPIMKESLILYERLAGEKKLAIIKGADHLYSKEEHLKEAREAIAQWFDEKSGSHDPESRIFKDRKEAGVQLASKLEDYKDREGVIVLALPRGGVVTGYEVASHLNCLLDVIIIRKLGFPGQPELAVGAVSETGTVVLNESIISTCGVPEDYIQEEISRQKAVIERRVNLYRKGQGIPELKGKTIILLDDGAATGATVKAAISTLKKESIERLIVALPVAPPETAEELRRMADEFICLETPDDFMAVGSYYHDFTQVTDDDVVEILESQSRG